MSAASMDLDALIEDYENDHDDEDDGMAVRDQATISKENATSITSPSSDMLKKSSLRARWLVLSLACVVMTGSYYAYDIPSALHQQLQDYMPQSPHFETQFNLLYTVYSIPNVILPLFGGNIVDRCGAPACLRLRPRRRIALRRPIDNSVGVVRGKGSGVRHGGGVGGVEVGVDFE